MRGAVLVVLSCAVLVLGVDAQEPVAMRCYQGVSYSRVATGPMNPTVLVPKAGVAAKAHYSQDELESPTVPEVVCNDTKDEIYIGCYSVCQQMHLQNMTAGSLDVPDFFIDVCRYGCATEVMINAMERWNGGALQFDFMCGCRWDRSGTFWTDENVDYKGSCICASVRARACARVPGCFLCPYMTPQMAISSAVRLQMFVSLSVCTLALACRTQDKHFVCAKSCSQMCAVTYVCALTYVLVLQHTAKHQTQAQSSAAQIVTGKRATRLGAVLTNSSWTSRRAPQRRYARAFKHEYFPRASAAPRTTARDTRHACTSVPWVVGNWCPRKRMRCKQTANDSDPVRLRT